MQALPAYLSSEIFKNLFFYQNYFCCEFDHRNLILQMWGQGEHLGLGDWTIHKNLEDEGFLQGMPMYDSWVLHDVHVAEGHYADIYFSPTLRGKKYLLFAPKTEGVKLLHEYQQYHHQHGLDNGGSSSDMKKDLALDAGFIKSVSKQLSAPVSLVLGSTYLLNLQENLPRKVQDQVDVIGRATHEMMQTLANLRDYMFFANDSFRLDINNISLENLMQQVTSVFAPMASNKDVAFSINVTEHCPDYLQIDSERVKQLLLNLLFTCLDKTNGSLIEVELDDIDNFLVVTIDFTAADLEGDPLVDIKGDHGQTLSLGVSKSLIDNMGGRLAFGRSDDDATFTIVIPYTLSSALEREKIEEVQQVQGEEGVKTILLVGREPIRVVRYKSYLNAMGHDVTTAGDGQLALALLEQVPFDLVITELTLPYLGGQELVTQMQSRGQTLPVIALSSSGEDEHLQELSNIGFTSVLVKPIRFARLLSELEKVAK